MKMKHYFIMGLTALGTGAGAAWLYQSKVEEKPVSRYTIKDIELSADQRHMWINTISPATGNDTTISYNLSGSVTNFNRNDLEERAGCRMQVHTNAEAIQYPDMRDKRTDKPPMDRIEIQSKETVKENGQVDYLFSENVVAIFDIDQGNDSLVMKIDNIFKHPEAGFRTLRGFMIADDVSPSTKKTPKPGK